jgi:tetratricopeptide (TPR) repeat protein
LWLTFVVLLALFLILLFPGIIVVILFKLDPFNIEDPEFIRMVKYAPSSLSLILVLISSFTIIPLAEELFFRGFLYNALKARLSTRIAAVLQAFIFTIIHEYSLVHSIPLFLFAIALVIVYEKRQDLLPLVFIHAIRNAVVIIPILVLAINNFHMPADNWKEAAEKPKWHAPYRLMNIEVKENGVKQWEYAIGTWGNKGSRQWKRQIIALEAVSEYFPDDRVACARAQLGIVVTYFQFLGDYRRAVFEADVLARQYPEQDGVLASALSVKGWAHYMLKDFERSRAAFTKVINEFSDDNESLEWVQKGIEYLNAVENRG